MDRAIWFNITVSLPCINRSQSRIQGQTIGMVFIKPFFIKDYDITGIKNWRELSFSQLFSLNHSFVKHFVFPFDKRLHYFKNKYRA